ncbi:universal stress protein [Sphingobacterium faecale]|uniref:Universal stress protein n=1 Tax=Sphingobacterium faecale TaxID=2803775 RepID=A0ABS1R3S6_9SPHI|nr:universal stress protein [Sphingobacterium faecale]MBL1409140.1 universal stress protein [Sphingobacterium faecale]
MRHILFPTDFSEAANNAFLYALNLANQLDTKLFVLYSYITPVLSATHAGQPEMLADVYQQVELSKFDYFKKQAPALRELAQNHKLDPSKLVFIFEEGTVVSSVKKVAKSEDIRLIVMGTYGASGFTEKFIGTNTVAVIQNVQQPVLAIPSQAKYAPIKKVAFTTLFREKDLPALEEVVSMASLVNAEVYCTHVMDDASNPAKPLLYGEDWGKKFQGKKLDFVFLEKKVSVEETINSFLMENKIDLLAIVKRNRNFFDRLVNSSLSNKLAFHSDTPILVFHEEKDAK